MRWLILGLVWVCHPLGMFAAPGASTHPVFRVDRPYPTADKPQSKLWYGSGSWWALLPGAGSPSLWQRSATGWVEHAHLRASLAGVPGRADVWPEGNEVTAVCIDGSSFAVLRLVREDQPVLTWKPEVLARWSVPSSAPVETATLARDRLGRWWLTAPIEGGPESGSGRDIVVWTSPDARTWQRLEPLARGVGSDDLCVVTPVADGIGVAWSDQRRDEVGFAWRRDGSPPEQWTDKETAAAGARTADDHLHAARAPDDTLWLATKNSVDRRGEPQLVLRVRESSGRWQNHSYAPRRDGEEPSRPVIIATFHPDLLLLGHTVYDRANPFRGRIEFGTVSSARLPGSVAFTRVITPAPELQSRINDLTTPKQAFPDDAPWIVLASDAQGRVFEADLRPAFGPPPGRLEARSVDLAGAFRTTAAQPPRLHRGELMRALEPLLLQQARALVSEVRPWNNIPGTALLPLTRRAPSSESGIRPNAHTAKGLALLARVVPEEVFPADFTSAQAREIARALLRSLIRSYGAGGETCTDGKPWREQWQSAYWAALAGEACWLLWDDLNPEERWLAARMICDEADRFVGVVPPTQLQRDSKAEENAWNSQVISLAASMFPAHPRHALWRETATRWIVSAFARSADLEETALVDGRPLRDWLTGANVFDDFTLENHSRVHPDYLACTYLLTSQIPLYAWGGLTPPDALHHNVLAIHRTLRLLATPEGSVVYPNGQDWGLHRNIDWLEYHAGIAVVYQDRSAATLLRQSLATVQRMAARQPDGTVYLPGETKLASDQAMVLEYGAHTYALMAQLGEGPAPLPDDALQAQLAGVHVFPAGRFAVIRSPDSLTTFSWGAQAMGQVVPLRHDLLLSPETRGLVGYVGLEGQPPDTPVVRNIVLAPLSAGFGLTGVLERAGGTVEQRVGFLTLPDGRVVYTDRVTATGPLRPTLLDLGTLGVLNDVDWPWHTGVRTLTSASGTHTFAATRAAQEDPVVFDSPWFHLDGLGIVRVATSGPARYVPAPSGAAGRLEQRFHLNTTPASRVASSLSDQPLAHGLFVFYPGASAAQTAAYATRCRLESAPGNPQVRLHLDDGTAVHIDLAALTLSLPTAATVSPRP
jgi:hypothetical protein